MTITRPVFALVATTGLGLLTACGVDNAGAEAGAAAVETPLVPVQTAAVTRSDIHANYQATATLSSDFDAPATARVEGEIVALLVEEGDRVQQGQILARLDGERLRLDMLSAKANLEKARKEYERNVNLHKRGLISAAMYEGLKYEVDALQATYDLKKLNYEYSNIRAPIAGVISAREVKPGQNLSLSDVAYRITGFTELQAHLQIPQSELSKFSPGHEATLEIASMPGELFPARIARISPTIDARNGTFRATATIDNDRGMLAPGMFAQFTISYETHTQALTIPAAALIEEDNTAVVYVVSDGEVRRRSVTTGIRSNNKVEILDGLDENEDIVVVGHSNIRDGSKVLAAQTETETTHAENFSG